MEAIKCDRCGLCFAPAEEEGDMIRFGNPAVKSKDDWKNGTCAYLYDRETVHWVDLCPTCTRDFLFFMSGGNREEELTEELHEKMLKKDREYNELMSKYLDLCEKNGDFSLRSDEL